MPSMGVLIAMIGFCGFFSFATLVVDPGRAGFALIGSRHAAILGSLASLVIMAVGTHV